MRDEADRLIQVVKDEYAIQDGEPGGEMPKTGFALDAWARQVGILVPVSLVHVCLTRCVVHLHPCAFHCENQPGRREH